MHRRSCVAVLIGAVTALVLTSPTSTQEAPRRRGGIERVNGREAAAGEVLLKFRRTLALDELARIGTLVDADANRQIGRTGVRRLRSRSLDAATLIALLANYDDVEYAEPNYIVHTLSEPNDPAFSQLWGLKNAGQAVNGSLPGIAGADIHATEAWDVSVGSTDTVVAVIDTGIDYTHPDLAANVWSAPADFTVTISQVPITCPAGSHGFNAIALTCDPMDDHHHGTHVAGTIGASGNNGVGVVGVNWTTQIMGLKFLDAGGSGTVADAINAIEFAIQARQAFAATGGANIRVLSNSWGGPEFSQALLDEVRAANDHDMLFVAGAGNDGLPNDFLPFYPASFDAPNVVAVAATDNTDSLAWFSNWGTSTVHLAAPGVDIMSTVPGSSYAFLSGTSMATPHVSGAAALVLSRCALDTADLKDTILSTVEPLASLSWATITGGRLDVNSAIHSCIAPPPTPTSLTALAGDHKVTLAWPAVRGAMRYSVKRAETAGGPYVVIASGIKATTYIDSAVVNDTTYYYVLSASNSAGESGDSNEVTATPRVPPDLVISSLTVPTVGAAGATIVVSETVRNQGAGAAGSSTTRFYLSNNSSFDANDIMLDGIHDVPALPAGATSLASVSVVIPSDATPGARYVIARADADNLLNESSESNNSVAKPLQIGPDLVVLALTVPATAAAGGPITVTDTVKNKGGGAAGASVTAFHLSTNNSLDSGDLLLGSRAVVDLAAGVSSVGTTTLTVPPEVTPGTYYVIAIADAGKVVIEALETNNGLARATEVGGDLVVSALTVPAKAAVGSDISVTETTRNDGAGGVSESTTRFYLSVNTTLGAGDTLLAGSHAVPALAPGASSTSTTSVTIPTTVVPGTYYLIARADADNMVSEVTDSNNNLARSTRLGGDLIVAALIVPAKGVAGSDITVTDTTTNQGGGAVATSITRFYLSVNSVFDSSDTLLGAGRTVPDLAAGASSSGTTTVTIPSTVAAGSYYIIGRADADNVVSETQETNNNLARQTTVGGDLMVSAFTVPPKIGAGSDVVVSETTTNQGMGDVAASLTRFYLSANTVVDANDTQLAGSHAVPDLAAGASSASTTTVSIPSTIVPGTYYLIAKADADNAVGEASESNNSLARTTQVGGDLIVSALAVPAKAGAGSDIIVSDTTANQGGGSVPASTLRFYLSSNTVLDTNDVLLAGSRGVPDLVSGGSSSGSTNVTIPLSVAPATYYVIAKADADNAAIETVENNNIMARAIQVGGDLIVSALTMPSTAASGSSIVVNDTTTNQGGGAVSASTTRFYLSTTPTFDATDTLLSDCRVVPALGAGEASAGSTTVVIPSGLTPKTYYVIAVADGDGVVGERVETNNALAKAISVTAGQ